MKTLLKVLCLPIFGVGLLLGEYYARQETLRFALPNGDELSIEVPWRMLILEGGLMLLGITFGYLYQRLQYLKAKGNQTVHMPRELKRMLNSTNFFLAVAASPVVFGVIIAASKGAPLLTSLFLAFQNGFFWQTVMPKQAEISDAAVATSKAQDR